ncbi:MULTISPECIES: phosphatase PAP2 family protein [Prauserella salsuginis group]|uniref:Membrane-associated phospholipid phosphatase n=2 Tax=Prauserella salsuginis group TaxID=2893672 RepID=A0A839XG34_9PSEU|nr:MULTISPECIES: phosphatase PAP2 family protein [Prauserella salsuginis group]MBB3661721.1 membrane-associated phospholipid phosphatase [Prauserella sediminis]MCR3719631.1 PAP2 superfamily protein [Prauserella flava]MCR3735355.1 PAP2 superfamily protein [Prauserella salsuginis]
MNDSETRADPAGTPWRRWPIVAAVSAIVAVGVYVAAVQTALGQTLENAALRGADEVGAQEQAAADNALDEITMYSLAAAVAVVALIGLLRRRLDLAIAGVGVIVAGQVVTQALKRYILPRPELVEVTGPYVDNSLPSGHTTIAMTVLFAVLIVVPYRWRGVALFLVLSWAVGIGAYTVTAKWHRLSDTLAADAIALAVACLVSWWLVRRGAVRRHDGPRRIPRVVLVACTALFGVLLLGMGVFLIAVPLAREGLDATVQENAWVVYLSAHSLASFGSVAAALAFLATWRRQEIP